MRKNTKIRLSWREYIRNHKIQLTILLITLTILFFVIRFVAGGFNSYQVARVYIRNACLSDEKKFKWLDCNKLQIDPPYPNEGYLKEYAYNSWVDGGQVRNERDEIIWGLTVEVTSNGVVRNPLYNY